VPRWTYSSSRQQFCKDGHVVCGNSRHYFGLLEL
jgi:hypothetical protein